jgi:hypothetical protein
LKFWICFEILIIFREIEVEAEFDWLQNIQVFEFQDDKIPTINLQNRQAFNQANANKFAFNDMKTSAAISDAISNELP